MATKSDSPKSRGTPKRSGKPKRSSTPKRDKAKDTSNDPFAMSDKSPPPSVKKTTKMKKRKSAEKVTAKAIEKSLKKKKSSDVMQDVMQDAMEDVKESGGVSYYLIKSEPESRIQNGHEMKFSIDDLANEPNATTHWDGVRNYEARNAMKCMKIGDRAFFYHSNTSKSRPSIVGEVEVVREAYPDHTAFDEKDPHFDAKSDPEDPRWFMVDVRLVRKFESPVSLDEVKENDRLANMQLVKRGRISVQHVKAGEWLLILAMAGLKQ